MFILSTIPTEQPNNSNTRPIISPFIPVNPDDLLFNPLGTKPPHEINPFNDHPVDPKLEKIKELTEQLKAFFKHPLFGIKPPAGLEAEMKDRMLQDLYKALSDYTGKEITDKRKEAVKAFFVAYGQGKACDVNADGKNDFNDVLSAWNKGHFDPLAWSPEEDTTEEEPPPPSPLFKDPEIEPLTDFAQHKRPN